jgi:hypothetical protein
MANDGRADWDHDRRYRALVLLAAFASLRVTPADLQVRLSVSDRD